MLNHVKDPNETIEQIAVHFEEILKLLGEDSSREGLIKTPIRAAKALYNSTKGYRADAVEIANQAIFEYAGSKMIIVKDIEFYSNWKFKLSKYEKILRQMDSINPRYNEILHNMKQIYNLFGRFKI